MISIKNTDVFIQLFIHPVDLKLVAMAVWIETHYPGEVITCGYEPRDYPSVHSTVPLRGLDIRSRHLPDPESICEDINKNWLYDPSRPHKKCAIYHDVGRGRHIHLQVHHKTEYAGFDPGRYTGIIKDLEGAK